MLRSIARRFAIGSLKGRHAVRDWQAQPGVPHRNRVVHRAPDEELKEHQSAINKAFDEDFRVKLFDLEPKQTPAEPVPDPVFGLEVPSPIPVTSGIISEVYRQDTDPAQQALSNLKQDYLSFCVGPQSLNDSALQALLDRLVGEHEAFCRSRGAHFNHISEEEVSAFYKSKREELVQLQMLARETAFQNLIPLTIALRFKAQVPKGEIYNIIEDRLSVHLHLFSLRELALVKFGTEFTSPKVTSLDFRTKLRKKICSSLDLYKSTISVRDFLYVFTSFRSEWNNYTLHYRMMKFIKFNSKRIAKACDEDPALAIDFLYTFANSRLPKRFRRLMFEENELSKEVDLVMEIVQKPLTNALKTSKDLTPAHLLRLLTSVSVLNLVGYDEIFHLLDKQLHRVQKEVAATPFLFAEVLNLLSISNGKKLIDAPRFLEKARETALKMLPKLIETDLSSALKILSALAKYRLADFKSFKRVFDALFEKLDKSEVGYRNLSTASFLVLALFSVEEMKADPASLERYSKVTFRRISAKKEFVPLIHWRDIKQFCFLVAHLYPAWRMDHIEILCYHAEKRFSTSRLRPKLMTSDVQMVANLMPRDLENKLLPLGDFHNLFLIDFAVRDIKLAIRLLTEDSVLSSSPQNAPKASIFQDIHAALIRLDDWTLCDIDFQKFNDMGTQRAGWVKEQVAAAYKLAVENSRGHVRELKLKAVKRMAAMAHIMFEDNKHKETYYAGEKFRAIDKLIGFSLDLKDLSRNELHQFADVLRLLDMFMTARGIKELTPESMKAIFDEVEREGLDQKSEEELEALGFSVAEAERVVLKYRHILDLKGHKLFEVDKDLNPTNEREWEGLEGYEGFEDNKSKNLDA